MAPLDPVRVGARDGRQAKPGGSILERAAATRDDRVNFAPVSPAGNAATSRPVSYAQSQEGEATAVHSAAAAIGGSGSASSEPMGAKTLPERATIDFARLAARGYITPDSPPSLTAEEFRLVKRQLLTTASMRRPGSTKNANLILVGSAAPGEGKTFIAMNLALSIAAERDLTVLLVDADVAKPEVVARLGIKDGPGLTDVIANRALDIGDCLIRTQIPNLTVLPAGRPHALATELFASERMDDLMQELARRYTDRIIVFDSPPALATSAASVLASHVGQVVFVVAAESTRETDLKEGLALMSACPNVQLLLNRSRFFPSGRRFSNHDYPG